MILSPIPRGEAREAGGGRRAAGRGKAEFGRERHEFDILNFLCSASASRWGFGRPNWKCQASGRLRLLRRRKIGRRRRASTRNRRHLRGGRKRRTTDACVLVRLEHSLHGST